MKNYLRYSILFLTLIACSEKNTSEIKTNDAQTVSAIHLSDVQAKALAIVTDSIHSMRLCGEIRLNGHVDVAPQNQYSVSVPIGGYLKTINLMPGMTVKKGETLATIEDPQYIQIQRDYLIAANELKRLNSEFDRLQTLNQNKASSDKELLQARTQLASAKIELASLREKLYLIHVDPEKLSETTISSIIVLPSPAAGMITSVNANIGQFLNPTDILLTLSNTSKLYLKLNAIESDLAELQPGMKYKGHQIQSEETFEGKITYINRAILNDGTSEVYAEIDNGMENLMQGNYVQAIIQTDEKMRPAVPADAIVQFEGKNYIFLAGTSNEYFLSEVQPGTSKNGMTEILHADDIQKKSIVTQGAYALLMTMKNNGE